MVSFIGSLDFRGDCAGVQLWVGDSPDPTSNTQFGGDYDCQFEVPVNAYGTNVFIYRPATGYLGGTQLLVFSDCDCRGVTWDNSGTTGFPLTVEVGQTASGSIPDVHDIGTTQTSSCASTDCEPSFDLTMSDGSPLKPFLIDARPTLTASPTLINEIGTYSVLMTQYVYQGPTNHVVNTKTYDINVRCALTSIAQNNAVNSVIMTARTFVFGSAPETFTPLYDLAGCPAGLPLTATLELVGGGTLPSFISLIGVYPAASV